MLIARNKFETNQKNYFKNLYEQYGQIPQNHQLAISLRQEFFNTYVLNRVSIIYISLIFMILTLN